MSVSTSTTAMWVPLGNVKFGGSKVTWASRLGSIPSGRSWAVKAAKATSPKATARDGVPTTRNSASTNSRSSSAASSWWAAMPRALSSTRSVAMATATPPTDSDRDP